ncbi:indolethylamine N-methyltransferase-like [Hyperolius riggenbachi]|uniref:indolethylamine N-methyltransferase-like n=1 Tax=Hyperolius riggenbachi TaxID=752182 RepID=UPI0035A27918
MSTESTSDKKSYHDKALKPKDFVETHFSHGQVPMIEECVVFPVRELHRMASKGLLKGSKLLDFSTGATVFQLLPLAKTFKDIYVVEVSKDHMEHFQAWLDKSENATDWSHASKRLCQLDGNREDWKEKEEDLRKAVRGVVTWENYKTTPLDPKVIPEVDCVLSVYMLNTASETKEEFQSILKNLVSRLKVHGQLVLFTVIDMSFYKVNEHRFSIMPLDEKTVQESVINAGMVIKQSGLMKAAEPNDLVDYSGVYYILADKVSE